MPLESKNPKGRHWENTALPIIDTLVPGSYTNSNITVDEYGRVVSAGTGVGGGGTGISVQDSAIPIAGGPFATLNFTGSNVTAAEGVPGVIDVTVSGAASIIAEDENAVVPNGPFSVINFVGDGVTAVDTAPGELRITIPGSAGTVIEDEGVVVPNGPFTTINFAGNGVVATDAGVGEVLVTVTDTENYVGYQKASVGIGATQNIGTPIPATAIIREVAVSITTPYDVGTTLQVEDGAGNVLMSSVLIDPTNLGTYIVETPQNASAVINSQIVLIVSGGPTGGSGIVDVLYQNP